MVADDGKVSEIGRVARSHDFVHRRLGPIDHHRCQHLGLTSGVLETQGERPVGRAEPEGEGAALPERVEVRREVERRPLRLEIQRLLEEKHRELSLSFQVDQKGGQLERGRVHRLRDPGDLARRLALELVEKLAEILGYRLPPACHSWPGRTECANYTTDDY